MDKSPTSPVGGIFHRLSNLRKSAPRIKKRSMSKKLSFSFDKEEEITEIFQIKDTEIPSKPCSVSQIREYIKTDELKQAYVNLLSLRLDIQQKRGALEEGASDVDLVNKETDIRMLFDTLKNKIADIVRSSTLQSVNKELLAQVVTIVLEENKKSEMMLGWMEMWRNAVRDGVRDTLKKVHLDKPEQNTSWLAVHLGLLGKAVEDDLKRVKAELHSSYPKDFNVFETYVSCYNEVVEEHSKELLEKVTEAKDYYTLLDFIIHRYPSDLRTEQGAVKLEQDFLNKIKNAYFDRVMEDFKAALKNIIILERDEVWKTKKTPDRTDDGFLTSHVNMDICQLIASYSRQLIEIDENHGKLFVRFSLEELHQFHKRFEEEFRQHTRSLLTSDLLDLYLWVNYHITYINTFLLLKEQMQCYRESCLTEVVQLEKDVDEVTQRLRQTLMDHFKTDIKPYINGMMTKKWIKTDEDFTEVTSRIESYSGLCKSMRNPASQIFVNDVHYYVIKEYVAQLMKKKYSCKNTKNEEAADKMRTQWKELRKLFQEMGSSLDWLYPLGNYVSDIIGMENEKSIKDILHPLVSDYPDISKKQMSAVLYFRDNGFSLERHQVINQFNLIKRDTGNIIHERSFFIDME
ncbi:exocyst complex component 3-like protein 4 [Triplophysa rosa]|uniref:exocyst complex component 3-like protein 4 n=1 Tax=Triplophysa rosa TaxID=992332 RepID=UPI002545EBA8|nr:exocyst complex component 3-like protein 4 [Triplophysa rosa]